VECWNTKRHVSASTLAEDREKTRKRRARKPRTRNRRARKPRSGFVCWPESPTGESPDTPSSSLGLGASLFRFARARLPVLPGVIGPRRDAASEELAAVVTLDEPLGCWRRGDACAHGPAESVRVPELRRDVSAWADVRALAASVRQASMSGWQPRVRQQGRTAPVAEAVVHPLPWASHELPNAPQPATGPADTCR
jgi:hypothetical protein